MDRPNPLDLQCPNCQRTLAIHRYHCPSCNLTVEGSLEVPPLGRLSMAEQSFVISFIRVHGNIKRMEQLFDISYPTVKSRLNAIAKKLDANFETPPERNDVLDKLGKGQLTVEEALKLLDQM